MIDSYPTPDDEYEKLKHCLARLSRDRGVWREDLIELLRGDLSRLQQHWGIRLTDGIAVARKTIAVTLHEHIRSLYPRRGGYLLTDKGEVERYRFVVIVSFNISDIHELARKDLQGRREWLERSYGAGHKLSMRTSQRILDDAIAQIAKRLVGGMNVSDESLSTDSPSATPNRPAQPPQPSPNLLSHLISLSGQVREALENRRDFCRARGRMFYTFDLLLALLDISDGQVIQCLETVEEGLAQTLRVELEAMPAPGKLAKPFKPFEWTERPDIRLAWQYALRDEAPATSDLHILLGVLDSASNTNDWLMEFLGQGHAELRAIAEGLRRDGPEAVNSPTPG